MKCHKTISLFSDLWLTTSSDVVIALTATSVSGRPFRLWPLLTTLCRRSNILARRIKIADVHWRLHAVVVLCHCKFKFYRLLVSALSVTKIIVRQHLQRARSVSLGKLRSFTFFLRHVERLKITYTGSVQVSSALSTDRRTRATISYKMLSYRRETALQGAL